MRAFIRTTWLPTSVALALTWPIVSDAADAKIARTLPLVMAVVSVPLVWRLFVVSGVRPAAGRSALAGATVGFLIPAMYVLARDFAYHRQRGADISPFGAGMNSLFFGALLTGALLIGGPSVP